MRRCRQAARGSWSVWGRGGGRCRLGRAGEGRRGKGGGMIVGSGEGCCGNRIGVQSWGMPLEILRHQQYSQYSNLLQASSTEGQQQPHLLLLWRIRPRVHPHRRQLGGSLGEQHRAVPDQCALKQEGAGGRAAGEMSGGAGWCAGEAAAELLTVSWRQKGPPGMACMLGLLRSTHHPPPALPHLPKTLSRVKVGHIRLQAQQACTAWGSARAQHSTAQHIA